MPVQTNPDQLAPAKEMVQRRRMGVVERERQILDGAIAFFAERGLDGQLRDLAKSIGVAHTLLYHYFPTKQALIDRVYTEVFEGYWRSEWEAALDDPKLSVEDKFTNFYSDYVNRALTRDLVRILVFSGLTDHTITDRFFALLRERLFPRLIRESRRFRGVTSCARPSQREFELLMSLHGGFFYVSMRRWIYGQVVHSEDTPTAFDDALVRDRVKSYLMSTKVLMEPTSTGSSVRPAARSRRHLS
ncbi:MAG TPA: TetR/AcrR family transcriptional regulator [Burkholderiales bacterium]|nr:TetR/AcrR family transcriptional regulator [Burkholderiales bacterium]